MHHLPAARVQAVVAQPGEEHDVARLQGVDVVDAVAHLGLRVRGPGQVHAAGAPGGLHQAGAVVAVGAGAAVDVGLADLGVGEVQRGARAARGAARVGLAAGVVRALGGGVGVGELGEQLLLRLDLLLHLLLGLLGLLQRLLGLLQGLLGLVLEGEQALGGLAELVQLGLVGLGEVGEVGVLLQQPLGAVGGQDVGDRVQVAGLVGRVGELLDLLLEGLVVLLLVPDLLLEFLVPGLGDLVVLLGLVVLLDRGGGLLVEALDLLLDLFAGGVRVGGAGDEEGACDDRSDSGRGSDAASRTPTTGVLHGGPRSLGCEKSARGCWGEHVQGEHPRPGRGHRA